MPVVNMPDGTPVNFPDDMPSDQIRGMILQKFPNAERQARMSGYQDKIRARMSNAQVDAATPQIAHKGYASQVADAFNGTTTKVPATDLPLADMAKGAAVGTIGGIGGIPGNLEAMGRGAINLGSRTMGQGNAVGPNVIPDTSQIESAIGGDNPSRAESGMRTAAEWLSPFGLSKGAGLAAKITDVVVPNVLGVSTGAGPTAIRTAYQAGKTGDEAGDAFLSSMRGNTPPEAVVQTARDAVTSLKKARSEQYMSGMADATGHTTNAFGDPAALNWKPVEDAISKTSDIGNYQGMETIPAASKVRQKVSDTVSAWQAKFPTPTPNDFDALKQTLWNLKFDGELSSVAGPGKPGAKIIDAVANAVKGQIVDQAPGYAKVMSDYSKASDTLHELETGMSLGQRSTTDTALRKLQSIMRNNANANYGQRAKLGDLLDDTSGGQLMPQLAGQSLSSAVPRSIAGQGLGSALGASTYLHPATAIPAAASTLLTSPRVVGEAAYKAGQMAKVLRAGVGQDPNFLTTQAARLAAQLQDR